MCEECSNILPQDWGVAVCSSGLWVCVANVSTLEQGGLWLSRRAVAEPDSTYAQPGRPPGGSWRSPCTARSSLQAEWFPPVLLTHGREFPLASAISALGNDSVPCGPGCVRPWLEAL